jgi:hypothetical protein
MFDDPAFQRSRNEFIRWKKEYNIKSNKVAKIKSIGWSAEEFDTMFSTLAEIPITERTTNQSVELLDLTISGWTAPRTLTKHQMQSMHLTVQKDSNSFVSDPTNPSQPLGCGWKIQKNWTWDKTNQIIPNADVLAGVTDSATTMYCQCHTHLACPVRIILEHLEAMKDGSATGPMKHKRGGIDGAFDLIRLRLVFRELARRPQDQGQQEPSLI